MLNEIIVLSHTIFISLTNSVFYKNIIRKRTEKQSFVHLSKTDEYLKNYDIKLGIQLALKPTKKIFTLSYNKLIS